jgi:hypothetical protein
LRRLEVGDDFVEGGAASFAASAVFDVCSQGTVKDSGNRLGDGRHRIAEAKRLGWLETAVVPPPGDWKRARVGSLAVVLERMLLRARRGTHGAQLPTHGEHSERQVRIYVREIHQ